MKNMEIKNLIINSLKEDNDTGKITAELLTRVDYDFGKDFEKNVITKIFNGSKLIKYEFDKRLRLAFKSVSIAASVAVILLATSIFLKEGNLSVNSLLGVEDDYSESIVYLLTGD